MRTHQPVSSGSPHKEGGLCEMHETMTSVITQLNLNIQSIKELVTDGNLKSEEFRRSMSDQVRCIGLHLQGIEREMLNNLTLVADIVQTDLKEHKERTEQTFAAMQSAAADTHVVVEDSMQKASQEMLTSLSNQMTEMSKVFATSVAGHESAKIDRSTKVWVVLIPLVVTLLTQWGPGIASALVGHFQR